MSDRTPGEKLLEYTAEWIAATHPEVVREILDEVSTTYRKATLRRAIAGVLLPPEEGPKMVAWRGLLESDFCDALLDDALEAILKKHGERTQRVDAFFETAARGPTKIERYFYDAFALGAPMPAESIVKASPKPQPSKESRIHEALPGLEGARHFWALETWNASPSTATPERFRKTGATGKWEFSLAFATEKEAIGRGVYTGTRVVEYRPVYITFLDAPQQTGGIWIVEQLLQIGIEGVTAYYWQPDIRHTFDTMNDAHMHGWEHLRAGMPYERGLPSTQYRAVHYGSTSDNTDRHAL